MNRSFRIFNIIKEHKEKILWQRRLQFTSTPNTFATEKCCFSYQKNDFHSSIKNFTSSSKFFSNQVVNEKEKSVEQEKLQEVWGGDEALKVVIFITNNIDDIISKTPLVLVFFSASWCPHCKKLKRPYGKAAVMAKNANLSMRFATFEIDNNLEVADAKGVIGIPVLKFYRDGKFVTNYKGKRTAEGLLDFAKDPPTSSKEPKKAEI